MAALDLPGAFGVHMQQFRVPVTMHRENRERLVKRFSSDVPSAVEGAGAVLLFRGGEQLTRHETDHEVLEPETIVLHI